MGIVFTTRGWSGAELEVQSSYGNETFAVARARNNARDVAEELLAWLDHPSRVWSPGLSVATLDLVDDGGGRIRFDFSAGPTSLTTSGNAAWDARICMRIDDEDAHGVTRGSCSAMPGLVGVEQHDMSTGARNRTKSWRVGHPTLAHRQPTVELGLDLDEAYALNECVRLAVSPRTAYLYDEMHDEWLLFAIGRCDVKAHREDDATKMSGTIDVLGGA